MLPVGNAQQQTFGGYIDVLMEMGGEGENKGDIFNNQQRLEAAMEGSGGGGADGGQCQPCASTTAIGRMMMPRHLSLTCPRNGGGSGGADTHAR